MTDDLLIREALANREAEIARLHDELSALRLGKHHAETFELQVENERLRKDVIHWREARRSCIQAGDMMKAEIERLREELSHCLHLDNHNAIVRNLQEAAVVVTAEKDAEIERLRADVAEWRRQAESTKRNSDYWYEKYNNIKNLLLNEFGIEEQDEAAEDAMEGRK